MRGARMRDTRVAEGPARGELVVCGHERARPVQHPDAGDARRAIGELSQSIEIDPKPGAAKRMYGVWYVDYLPYFQLAQAHARLGNWPCAANALTLSQRYDEARFGVLDPTVVTTRTAEVKRESAAAIDAGSCRKEDFIDPEFARAADAN